MAISKELVLSAINKALKELSALEGLDSLDSKKISDSNWSCFRLSMKSVTTE